MVHANACIRIVLKREPILKKEHHHGRAERSSGMDIVINSAHSRESVRDGLFKGAYKGFNSIL
jgi:hypothetical protein